MRSLNIYLLFSVCVLFLVKHANGQALYRIGNVSIENTTAVSQNISFYNKFLDHQSVHILPNEIKTFNCITPGIIYYTKIIPEPFIVHDGDLLKLTLNNNNNQVVLKTNSVERTNELFALKYIKDLTKPTRTEKERSQAFDDELHLMENPLEGRIAYQLNYNNELTYLDKYSKAVKISNVFKDQCKLYFFYKSLKDKSMHLLHKDFHQNRLPQAYKDTLINLKQYLNRDECIGMKVYQELAGNYLAYLEYVKKDAEAYSYIKSEFKGTTRDLLLFTMLRGYFLNKKELFKSYYKKFLEDCDDSDYKTYVTNLYDFQSDATLISKNELFNTDGTRFSFSNLLKKYKGKVVYIDFWASWCSPCLEEMPSSIALSKKNANNNVVFLYFSLDKNVNEWRSTSKLIGLTKESNFLIIGDFNAMLAKHFKITSIPHYVLIGKDGKVISDNAPRPSDPKLETLFKSDL